MSNDYIKLTVPNDISYLDIINTTVKETAKKYGFSDKPLYQIQLGVEEAAANVIKHAFEGESGDFDVICRKEPLGIRIVIKEKGVPFDPKRLPVYSRISSLDDADKVKGLGSFLMKAAMDEVVYKNLGAEGKETHLVKYLPYKSIEDMLDDSERRGVSFEIPAAKLAVEKEGSGKAAAAKAAEAPVEKIEYIVRRMEPAEAIEVSKGAYKSHGYTFFEEYIYYPEEIVQLNQNNLLISAVAVTKKDNKFMGHAALVYPDADARIAEFTYAFVNPEYRGQGCLNKLMEFLYETAQQVNLSGLYVLSVTNHPFTQKTMMKYGFKDCGMLLATGPTSWKFKGINEIDQRITDALSFRYIVPPQPLKIYAPAHHKTMIEKCYRNIGAAQNTYLVPAGDMPDLPRESKIATRVYAGIGDAEIWVEKYGANVVKETKKILSDLCKKQVSVINLYLGLEDPATYYMTAELEMVGFFFAGILPCTYMGDTLILQYLNNVPLDYSKVEAHSDMAKELLAYIKSNDITLIL